MKKDLIPILSSTSSWILTITQANEVFQLIELILSILATLLTVFYILIKWYKKATEDGNISPEEVKELIEELNELKKEKDNDNK